MTRRLMVSILPDGTISAEASGTPGPSCLDGITEIEQICAAVAVDSTLTPEYHARVYLDQSNPMTVEDSA
jgi:Protein of unknown function (DUF2997)